MLMMLRRGVALLALAIVVLVPAGADEGSDRGSGFAAGFGLSDTAGNFGMNVELSSPTFFYDLMSVRLQATADYASAAVFATDADAYWEPFYTFRAGLAAGSGVVRDLFRYYGEFGGLAMLPSAKLEATELRWGMYGLFGFEFFLSEREDTPVAYYIELGSAGIDARADQLSGTPFYYNGFHTAVGFRFYF
jgi:hypothetical protein